MESKILPNISKEQQNIIDLLKNQKNVIVEWMIRLFFDINCVI